MRQTLFTIPNEIAGWPVFGFGWLLAVWAAISIGLLAWLIYRYGWNAETRGYLPTLAVGAVAIAFLLPALANSEGLPIRGYGVMLLVAVTSAVALAMFRAHRIGLDPEVILSLAFWMFISGIVGARLFYVIEYWDAQFHRTTLWETAKAVVNIPSGGLVVYGSLIGAGLALMAFVHKYRLPGLALSDLIAPSMVLGLAIGRIGCFLNGCCYGGVCDLPWAVRFPDNAPPYLEQLKNAQLFGVVFSMPTTSAKEKRAGVSSSAPEIERVYPNSPAAKMGLVPGDRITRVNKESVKTIEQAQEALRAAILGVSTQELVADEDIATGHVKNRFAPRSVTITTTNHPQPREIVLPRLPAETQPVHPAQLYSAVDALLLCMFLLAYSPYRHREGELTALLLTIHPVSRFLLEVIRVDESAVFHTGLSISQNISLLLVLGAVALWIYVLRQPPGLQWPRLTPQPA